MFDNAGNRYTVYDLGLDSDGDWQTTERVCTMINTAGYAITTSQTEKLLISLRTEGKVESSIAIFASGKPYIIWRKTKPVEGG